MKIASVADVKAHFSAFLKASQKSPIVITRNGKPIAVLVNAGDEEDLERLLMAHSPKLQAILKAARKRLQSGGGISNEAFWQQVDAEDAPEGKKRTSARKNGLTKRRT